MNETDEELLQIYLSVPSDVPAHKRMFAAMRLAMEKAREEERDAIESGKNVMHALLCSRNEDEVAAQWARQTPVRGIVGGESETEVIDEAGDQS